MFARDVRELFLLPYAEAWKTDRLRGPAAAILGPVLSGNGSVALDALIARGCLEPSPAVDILLDGMLERAHPRGYFFEPHERTAAETAAGRPSELDFLAVTAAYLRYLVVFGRGRDSRVRDGFDWLVNHQDSDGAWRHHAPRHGLESYLLTRRVAEAFAVLPATALKRWGGARRRLAGAWSARILANCDDPDAVLPHLNVAPDPRARRRSGAQLELPASLTDRVLYFALEDLALALEIGASPKQDHLAVWIEWLRDSQLTDGSWRLGNPSLRERLLLSDPNGRLRAEALYLTDEWITLRAAQVMRAVQPRSRVRAAVPVE
ncbi:MAG: hypothetical protein R3B81_07525 [bacterium]